MFRGLTVASAGLLPVVVQRYCQGTPIRRLAAELGIYASRVTRLLDRAGSHADELAVVLRSSLGVPQDVAERYCWMVAWRRRTKTRQTPGRRLTQVVQGADRD
jgi:hypothetical protein